MDIAVHGGLHLVIGYEGEPTIQNPLACIRCERPRHIFPASRQSRRLRRHFAHFGDNARSMHYSPALCDWCLLRFSIHKDTAALRTCSRTQLTAASPFQGLQCTDAVAFKIMEFFAYDLGICEAVAMFDHHKCTKAALLFSLKWGTDNSVDYLRLTGFPRPWLPDISGPPMVRWPQRINDRRHTLDIAPIPPGNMVWVLFQLTCLAYATRIRHFYHMETRRYNVVHLIMSFLLPAHFTTYRYDKQEQWVKVRGHAERLVAGPLSGDAFVIDRGCPGWKRYQWYLNDAYAGITVLYWWHNRNQHRWFVEPHFGLYRMPPWTLSVQLPPPFHKKKQESVRNM